MVWKITFTHKVTPLNVTNFITCVRNWVLGANVG